MIFPDAGFTKRTLFNYYAGVASFILPHLKNRPLTLKLYPHGVAGRHIYLKDAPHYTPPWVQTISIPRRERARGRDEIDYVLVNDRSTLLWAANLANIEMHVFLAKAPRIERPTSVVFDLDPGEPATIVECCKIALTIRKACAEFGLESFVKVSGSRGLHVFLPLNTPTTYESTGRFARAVARGIARLLPQLAASEMAKSARSGRVFIDWSQNVDYKSTVAPYSLRAKAAVPWISMPVSWREVTRALKAAAGERLYFSPDESLKRLKKLGDAFEPVLTLKQKLPMVTADRPALARRSRNRRNSINELGD